MDINYSALVNAVIMAKIKQENPMSAKLINVFLKRGISASEAMEMLLEMICLIEEMEQEQGENEH